jgi:hypothetical protein
MVEVGAPRTSFVSSAPVKAAPAGTSKESSIAWRTTGSTAMLACAVLVATPSLSE